jgi:hypothetical protein
MALKALTAPPTNNTNPYVGPNFTGTYPMIEHLNNLTAKWDQNISAKDRLSVRFTRSTDNLEWLGGYYADPINPLSGMGTNANNSQTTNVAINYIRTLSPSLLNQFQVGILREPNHQGSLADFSNWDSKLGIQNPFSVNGWPTIFSSEANGAYLTWDSNNEKQQHLTSESIEDNVTWTHGRHILQFGFRGRKEQNNVEELQQAQGSDSWGPSYTSNWDPVAGGPGVDTGSGFAELALGLPNYLSNQYNRGFFYFRQTQLGLYINDKIKVSRKLTLSLGLRWDYWTPYSEARNRLVLPYEPDQKFEMITPGSVNLNNVSGALPSALAAWSAIGLTTATANSIGYPSGLFNQIHHDYGPRLGAAYQINHNTVIRGSYGIYYVPEPLSLLLASMRNNPPLNLRYVNNPYYNTNVPGGANGAYFGQYPNIARPATTDYLPSATVSTSDGTLPNAEGNSVTSWDGRNWNDSRDQTWNITLEHELPAHTGMRLSYIGTFGGNLLQNYDLNDPEPKYNYAVRTGLVPPGDTNQLRGLINWAVQANNHTGYSRDNSLQAEIHRTFANGLSFESFYTFTRQLTTTDPPGGGTGGAGLNGGFGQGGVPENFEIKGEPNLSYAQRLHLVYMTGTAIPPHHVGFNGIYSLPFGKSQHFARNISTPLNYLVGGWQVATIGLWNSGNWRGISPSLVQTGSIKIPAGQRALVHQPGSSDTFRQWNQGITPAGLTIVSGSVAASNVRQAGPNCSGSYVGQLAVTLANSSCYNAPFNYYNPAPRVNVVGPGAWGSDLSLYKHFKIAEKVDVRFSADAFNVLNHPNDPVPNSTTGFQDLGQENTALGGPRQIQLSLRFEF